MRASLICLTLAALLVAPACLFADPATTGPAEVITNVTPTVVGGTQTGTQTPASSPAETQAPASKPSGIFDNPSFIFILGGGLILMLLLSSRTRKKQESKHRHMLDSLKKGDKVTTIGGIRGTVIEVREDEVTVKVDESGNVRMRFARWAIRDIGDAKPETPGAKPEEQPTQTK